MGKIRESRNAVLTVVGVIAAFAVLAIVIIYLSGGIKQLTASFRGETETKEITEADGAFRVTSYDRFFEICSDVQAKEQKIRNAETELKKDDLSDQRKTVLEDSVFANENQRAELITQYNGLTSNKYRAAYKDKGLPDNLDESNHHTECKL